MSIALKKIGIAAFLVLAWLLTFGAEPIAAQGGSGAVCPCSIWDDSVVPPLADAGRDNAVELGVKFRADLDGYISGIRFYKAPTNSGPHVGNLWSTDGVRLATVAFDEESDSGWQTALFEVPVAIRANTTYIASYYTTVGHYAFTVNQFTSAGVSNGPLRALADSESSNGVYRYSSVTAFPNHTHRASNYWVDVVFETDATQSPLRVVSTSPSAGVAASVPSQVSVTFSQPMNAATINDATFSVRDGAGAVVDGSLAYDDGARRAVFTPAAAFSFSTSYSIVIRGGTSGVLDSAGHRLLEDHAWTFTVGAPPPPMPADGPGGPILIITSAANPFTSYYAEILRAEGLNAFLASDISTVTASVLAAHDVAILGEMPLTASQVTVLSDWVAAGGRLIAMRPDKKLASLLGLSDAGGVLREQYLQLDTTSGPGVGLVAQTMQFHGDADLYIASDAVTLATLYASATTSADRPAVTLRQVGVNGGQAAAFAYDLARSIVYTRQGNPAWAGQERDGYPVIRSNELFFGGAEPDWVDLNKVAIPQADEQQRLLANLILQMNLTRRPLPRFWYLPRDLKAAVIMTGDDHGRGGTIGQFDWYRTVSPPRCSVEDWTCVRATSYIFPNTPITPAQAASYDSLGFELGVHVNTGCADYTRSSLEQFFTAQLAEFQAAYGGLPAPTTNRNHCIAWSDWSSQASVSLQHGIRLDTNYYYWPATWVSNRAGMFTGSGMPMRFADATGRLIDVYQAATQMTDESQQVYAATADALLDRALGPEGYYGVFTANMHTDASVHGEARGIVTSALARGVPVIAARQMLTWLDGRNGSTMRNTAWSGGVLTFTIDAATGARGLRVMVPASSGGLTVQSVTAAGAAVPFTRTTIKGIEYAVFDGITAAYRVTYTAGAPDTTIVAAPPVRTSSQTAQFEFAATAAGSTFECALNNGAFAPCSSPATFSGLPEGGNTLQVRARDAAGTVDPSPAFTAWTIDVTRVSITGRSPAAGATAVATSASVSVQFSETVNPATVSGASFLVRRQGQSNAIETALTVSGNTATLRPAQPLDVGGRYEVFVAGTVADLAGNVMGADQTWTFATASRIVDSTVADFSAGTIDATGTVTQVSDGEVMLVALENSDFNGTALPAGWAPSAWTTGGAATVANGRLSVNGARLHPAALYAPGRALEFSATFTNEGYQHVGFGLTLTEYRWAIFSTGAGGTLYARTHNGTSELVTALGVSLLNAPHAFRIDWTPTSVVYSVDGATVATHQLALSATLHPIVSDYATSTSQLVVDWLRMTPYGSSSTFTSRVFDAGYDAEWNSISWQAAVPAGTAITVSIRTGNTAAADASWSAFTPVAASGESPGLRGRYAQYRVQLTTTSPSRSPSLQEVTLTHIVY